MINLLSDIKKNEIRAARTNTILLRYIIVLLAALLFTAGVMLVSYQSLRTSEVSADNQLALSEGSAPGTGTDSPQTTRVNTEQITAALQAPKVSEVLVALAQALPAGTVMESITLTDQQIQGSPLTLTIYAKEQGASEDLRNSLESSGAFRGTTIASTETDNSVPEYPVKIELTTSINTGAGAPPADTRSPLP